MNYLTNHYKNLCEQYQSKINILQNLLNEDAPASTFSGTGQGQQTFSDDQLRDQMKQNRRTGLFGAEVADDKQNQAFRDAQAELARRSQANDEEKTLMTGVAKELGMSPEDMLAQSQYAQKRWNKYATPTPSPKPSATPDVTPKAIPEPTTITQTQTVPFQGQSLETIERQVQKEKERQTSKEAQPTGPGRKGVKPSQTVETSSVSSQTEEPTPSASLNAKEVTDTIMKLTGMNQNIPEPDATETKIPEMGKAQSRRTTYVVPESEAWNNLTTEEQHEMITSAISNNEVHKFFGGRLANSSFDKESGRMGFTTNPENFRFSEDNSGQTPEETARLNRQAKMLNQMMAEREKQGQRDTQQRKAREAELSGQTISTGGMNQPMDLADFPDDEDTDKQSSSAELENARKLAQMYANRMGRRVSKAPTPTPVAPKDKEIILDKTANNMDQNNLDKWFMSVYGVDKFNTIPSKQRNAMLMQYNQSKVKR